MTHRLTKREMTALDKAKSETDYLNGDYFRPAALGAGIGKGTIDALCALDLLERGYSNYHREHNCIRITDNGEKCLYGGYTWDEILAATEDHPSGIKFYPPKVLTWPVTDRGYFR